MCGGVFLLIIYNLYHPKTSLWISEEQQTQTDQGEGETFCRLFLCDRQPDKHVVEAKPLE